MVSLCRRVALIMTLGASSALAQTPILCWERIADFEEAPDCGIEGAAASLIDGKLYVSHGHRCNASSTGASRRLSIYDIATNTWNHMGPEAALDRLEMAGGLAWGKHYAIGGWLGGRGCISDACGDPPDPQCDAPPFITIEEFDPQAPVGTQWTVRTSRRRGAMKMGAASWDGKIYVVSGRMIDCIATPVLEVFDPLGPPGGEWTTLAPVPFPTYESYATVAHDGKIYVFGGAGALNRVQVYDIATSSWSERAPMPSPGRYGAMAGVIWEWIAVFGGRDEFGAYLRSTKIYDPSTDFWFDGPDMVQPAAEMAQGVTSDGWTVYAIGSGYSTRRTIAQRLTWCWK